jgi:anti-sigma B factor antagonist
VNPSQESFKIDVADTASGARVMKLAGPLTIRTLFDFQTVSRQEMTKPVIVDLSGVPYMDSAGLGCVVSVFTSCQNRGLGFGVCGLTPRLLTLFEVTHVYTLLPIFESVEAAEAGISKSTK